MPLILVGDGPLRSEVMARLRDLEAHVFCAGYVPNCTLPEWYGLSDVFVHPSPDEPWGVSVNEALAVRLPVVASSGVGAAAELLLPRGAGLVFPAGDARALADAIERHLRERCAHMAREVARAHDSAQTIGRFQEALAAVADA